MTAFRLLPARKPDEFPAAASQFEHMAGRERADRIQAISTQEKSCCLSAIRQTRSSPLVENNVHISFAVAYLVSLAIIIWLAQYHEPYFSTCQTANLFISAI